MAFFSPFFHEVATLQFGSGPYSWFPWFVSSHDQRLFESECPEGGLFSSAPRALCLRLFLWALFGKFSYSYRSYPSICECSSDFHVRLNVPSFFRSDFHAGGLSFVLYSFFFFHSRSPDAAGSKTLATLIAGQLPYGYFASLLERIGSLRLSPPAEGAFPQ